MERSRLKKMSLASTVAERHPCRPAPKLGDRSLPHSKGSACCQPLSMRVKWQRSRLRQITGSGRPSRWLDKGAVRELAGKRRGARGAAHRRCRLECSVEAHVADLVNRHSTTRSEAACAWSPNLGVGRPASTNIIHATQRVSPIVKIEHFRCLGIVGGYDIGGMGSKIREGGVP